MVKAKQPPGPPMTLGNMRHLGVNHLIATCLSDACRHQGLIDVSKYPDDTDVPSFANKVVCAKCGARGRHIDVRPNRKEQSSRPSLKSIPGPCRLTSATRAQPTLIMMGRDDPLVPPVNGCILARLIPNAQLQMIDDGHLFMVTRPVETARMIEAFLKER